MPLTVQSAYRRREEAAGSPDRLRGLGDLVHALAQPIARVLDRVAGTKLRKCGKCKRRRTALNRAFPFPGKDG